MTTIVYRKSRAKSEPRLGYLIFDHETRRATRYTPNGDVINVTTAWCTDFNGWLRGYSEFWSVDPGDAFFNKAYYIDVGL